MAKQGNWPGKLAGYTELAGEEPLPYQIHLKSVVSPEMANRFLQRLRRKRWKELFRFFSRLASLHPLARLRRNLKGLIDRASEAAPIQNFMRDALTEVEKDALTRLTSIETPGFGMQLIGQRLLNIEERHQLYMFVRGLFDSQRNVVWPEDGQWSE